MASDQFTINVIAQGLARVLSIVANLVLIIVVARAMGAAQLGAFSYVLAFVTIAAAMADLGTTAVLARGLAQSDAEQRCAYLGNFLVMRLVLVAIVTLVAIAIATLQPDKLMAPMLIAAVGVPVVASRFFEPIYQICKRPWMSLWSNLVFGGAQLLLAAIVWLHPAMDLPFLVGGYVVTNLVYAVVALTLMLRLIRPRMRPNRDLLRSIVCVAAPIGVSALFTTVIARADVIILGQLRTTFEVGLYSAASKFVDLAVFAAVTVVTPLIPILSREILVDRRAALQRCRQLVQVAGICTLPIAIVMPVMSDTLLAIVFGQDFRPAAGALTILAWNVVLIVLTLLGSSINLANSEVNHGYWNTLLAAIVNLALNLWLIPRIGVTGAALAALGAQVCMMAVSHYYTLTRFGMVYDPRSWLRIALACGVLTVVLLSTRDLGAPLSAVLSLTAYATAVVLFGLVPSNLRQMLSQVRTRLRQTSA